MGSQLARATQTAHAAWLGMEGNAAVMLTVMAASGLPPRDAAELWLAWGSAEMTADFLAIWQQITACGIPREQLEQLAAAVKERKISPGTFTAGMTTLFVIYGNWAAAAAAAAADNSLLLLPAPTNKLRRMFEQLQAAGCSPQQLQQIAQAVVRSEDGKASFLPALGSSLTTLNAILGSWTAAVEAALENGRLLLLKAPTESVLEYCRQLRAEGDSQQQLRHVAGLLAQLPAVEGASLDGLRTLQCLLGSREAALEAATANAHLLRLPAGAEAEEAASQLHAAGVPPEQLLQLIGAEFAYRLSSPILFDSLRLLRELLGDWHAALDIAVADRRLLRLPGVSDTTLEVVQQLRSSGLSRHQLAALISSALLGGKQAAGASEDSEGSDSDDMINDDFFRILCDSDEDDSDEEDDSIFQLINELEEEDMSFPEDPFAGMPQLCLLLGSWKAAGEAVLMDGSLLKFPTLSSDQRGIWASLAASGLSQMQLLQLLRLLSSRPAATNAQLEALQTASLLLSGDWRAAAEAALHDAALLKLPPRSNEIEQFAQQLATAGYSQMQRLQLATALARTRAGLASLPTLETLLGSWRAAVDAVLEDAIVLYLPTGPDMQVHCGECCRGFASNSLPAQQ